MLQDALQKRLDVCRRRGGDGRHRDGRGGGGGGLEYRDGLSVDGVGCCVEDGGGGGVGGKADDVGSVGFVFGFLGGLGVRTVDCEEGGEMGMKGGEGWEDRALCHPGVCVW